MTDRLEHDLRQREHTISKHTQRVHTISKHTQREHTISKHTQREYTFLSTHRGEHTISKHTQGGGERGGTDHTEREKKKTIKREADQSNRSMFYILCLFTAK